MNCRHCGVKIVQHALDSAGPVWMHERLVEYGVLAARVDSYRLCRAQTVAEPEGALS